MGWGLKVRGRREFQVGNSLGTPGCFSQRVRKWLKRWNMFFALRKEWQRRRLANHEHRQSRWLSKERG